MNQRIVGISIKVLGVVIVVGFVGYVLFIFEGGPIWKTTLLAGTAIVVYAVVRFHRFARDFGGIVSESEDVRSRDNEHRTPLHRAAVLGKVDVAQVLIANGADVNAKDEYAAGPLSYAVGAHELAMARLLLESGAEVDEEMVRYARELANTAMTELLHEHWTKQGAPSVPTSVSDDTP